MSEWYGASDGGFLKQRMDDYRSFLETIKPNWMVTVNYKRPLQGPVEERERVLMKDLQHWTTKLLQKLYGRKVAKRNANDEMLYAAFIQVGESLGKEHLHLLVRVPYRFWLGFGRLAKSLWKTTDDVDVQLIDSVSDAVRYCSRDLTINPDRVFFSNGFRRSQQ